MGNKICSGLKVMVECGDPPVSMGGTILHVDSQTLAVSLAPEGRQDEPRSETPVRPSGEVQVSATADDALYRFTSTLLRSSDCLLYLSSPREVRRVQRRDDVRQPCLLDVELVIPIGEQMSAKPERATAVNISRGGLLIVFNGRLEVGDAVRLSMKLPGGEPPIKVAASVVRRESFSHLGQDLVKVALHITGLQRADERRLTQFITRCQVKVRTGAA